MEKLKTETEEKYRVQRSKDVRLTLPSEGLKEKEILDKITAWAGESKKYYTNGGNITGAVYVNDENHWDFIVDAMRQAIVSNPLHVDEFAWVT
jgi:hypothetical protein